MLTAAFTYAQEAHAGQKRRGYPMIAHLMGVASLALVFGANEDEAIAALLHDAVEDCGGRQRLVDIRNIFGDVVAEIVDGCTDDYEDPPDLGANANRLTLLVCRKFQRLRCLFPRRTSSAMLKSCCASIVWMVPRCGMLTRADAKGDFGITGHSPALFLNIVGRRPSLLSIFAELKSWKISKPSLFRTKPDHGAGDPCVRPRLRGAMFFLRSAKR